MADVLVLCYSATGSVRALAQSIARGRPVSDEESRLAFALGKRLGDLAKKIAA